MVPRVGYRMLAIIYKYTQPIMTARPGCAQGVNVDQQNKERFLYVVRKRPCPGEWWGTSLNYLPGVVMTTRLGWYVTGTAIELEICGDLGL